MAIIPCSECKAGISDRATACPHCGAPVTREPARSTGKTALLVVGLVIGIPIALFFGSAIIAGILDGGAKHAETKPFTGRMKIDHGTEYVLTPEKSHAGGQCEGWSAVAIQAPGDSAGAMKDLMCWRRNGSGIEVNTANGTGRRTDPESVFSD